MKVMCVLIPLGLIAIAGSGAVAAHGVVTVQPMVTPTTRELGYEQGYPPQGQCRVDTAAPYTACRAPLDGLRVQVTGSPQAGLFVTLPSSTTETADHRVRVKAAVDNPAISDQVRQTVFGQLLVRGRPVTGARMHATWRYRGGERRCTGKMRWYGVVACSQAPLAFRSRDGDAVRITVSFTYGNRLYQSSVVYRAFGD